MIFKSPLKTRIIFSFVILTLIIGSIFAIAVVEIFRVTEAHTITRELNERLTNYSRIKPPATDPFLNSATTHYYSDATSIPIPVEYQNVKFGLSETVSNHEALFVYRKIIDGHDYMVVMNKTVYEAYEMNVFKWTFVGFILSVFLAGFVGWLLSNQLISPIVQLAREVLARNPTAELTTFEPLVGRYANDEVGQLAEAFDKTLLQLNEALLRERLFTSDVSHEFRTALMVSSSSSEILLKQLTPNSKQYELAFKIQRSSQAMQRLVQTFLTLARAKEKETDVLEKVSLLDASKKLLNQWEPEFKLKKLELGIVQRAEIFGSNFNAVFVEIVMSNLIKNALLYTHQGKVLIILEDNQFSIEDTGIGIPLEDHKRIFEPFVRGSSDGDGLGLGLSLVQRICTHQGWKVTVESLQPTGTRFTVHL
ncbi:sensor histidine kinase [Methylotenera versatilis]|uniref:sensor histidine kinase n=1 Tax=Methylotenera versatilis TaxID=1055487 RepID=UPI00064583E4|nr:HAMP domain-containing sensor histidine kinase [Methylotenera versatilis]